MCVVRFRRYDAYFVDLFVRVSNSLAIGMYEKFGYSVYRRVLGYYSSDHDTEDAFGGSSELLFVVEHQKPMRRASHSSPLIDLRRYEEGATARRGQEVHHSLAAPDHTRSVVDAGRTTHGGCINWQLVNQWSASSDASVLPWYCVSGQVGVWLVPGEAD
jgi:hypothetical protein